MTFPFVVPAKAGTRYPLAACEILQCCGYWIPAFAGMTKKYGYIAGLTMVKPCLVKAGLAASDSM